MSTIGQYIAERRKALGLRQEDLAERLKTYGAYRAATTIANWEADRQAVPLEMIDVLSLALEERSPVALYDMAGVLTKLPGHEIIKALDGLSMEDVERVERMILAFVGK
jgi:transcriptional regulator with XRE-family HTH domain